MPRSHTSGGDDGGSSRKRYAATVEKGENAWKREWSSFMSGVNLKRLRDGSSGVSLKASADIERQLESAAPPPATLSAGDVGVNGDGIPLNAGAASASFSYLFSSPAERRAEREARERAEKERRRAEKRERMAQRDPLSVMSKHQRALYDAQQRGLQLDGMNRKTRRDFLRLTVTEAQKQAEAQSREFKLHDLMDEKLAWYQQGPHPVDLIAEKLVRRKAEKKAKQLGLKYNYLAPHASWLAKRAQRRRESLLVGLGKRLVFQENYGEDGNVDDDTDGLTVTDPLRQRTVPLRDMGLLLAPAPAAMTAGEIGEDATTEAAAAAAAERADASGVTTSGSADEEEMEEAAAEAMVASAMEAESSEEDDDEGEEEGKNYHTYTESDTKHVAEGTAAPPRKREKSHKATSASAVAPQLPDVGVLQDPARLATSFVRSVVRDRATAVAIQQMNRTTTFLTAGLVKGPSLNPEDNALAQGLSAAQLLIGGLPSAKPPASATAKQPKRPTRSSAMPSFSPYAASFSPMEEAEDKEERAVVSDLQRSGNNPARSSSPSFAASSEIATAAPHKHVRTFTYDEDEDDKDEKTTRGGSNEEKMKKKARDHAKSSLTEKKAPKKLKKDALKTASATAAKKTTTKTSVKKE